MLNLFRTMGVLLITLGASACGGPTSERLRPVGPTNAPPEAEGMPTAAFTVGPESPEDKSPVINFWSEGAYLGPEGKDGKRPTWVHIGMRVENHSSEPVFLDGKKLHFSSMNLGEGAPRTIKPRLVELRSKNGEAELVVPPKATREINATFELPGVDNPQEVDSFRFHYALGTNAQSYPNEVYFTQDESGVFGVPEVAGVYVLPYYPTAAYPKSRWYKQSP